MQLEDPIDNAITALITTGTLLNLLSWRKRSLASLLIYFELVYNSVHALRPYDYGDAGNY